MPSSTALGSAPALPVQWRVKVDWQMPAFIADPPSIFDIEEGSVVRRDARSGREAWRHKAAPFAEWHTLVANSGFVALAAGRVESPEPAGSFYPLVVLGADDGRFRWWRALDREVELLELHGEILSIVHASSVLALDAATGVALTPWLRGDEEIEEPAGLGDSGAVFHRPAQVFGARGSTLLTLHRERGKLIVSGWSRHPPAPRRPSWRSAVESGELPGDYDSATGVLSIWLYLWKESGGVTQHAVFRFDDHGSVVRQEIRECDSTRLRPVRLASGARAALVRDCSGVELVAPGGRTLWRNSMQGAVAVEDERPSASLWHADEVQWVSESGQRRGSQRMPQGAEFVYPVEGGLLAFAGVNAAYFDRDETLRWSCRGYEHALLDDGLLLHAFASDSRWVFTDIPSGRPRGTIRADRFLGEVAGATPLLVFYALRPTEVLAVAVPRSAGN
jgi:hypothetical protein